MRALKSGVPRTFGSHKTPKAAAYRDHVRALLERLGPLPRNARVLLREAGRLGLDLQRLREDQDAALRRGRRAEARALDDRLVTLRSQLLTFEARLEELTGRNGHRKVRSGAELLAMRGRR